MEISKLEQHKNLWCKKKKKEKEKLVLVQKSDLSNLLEFLM